ncbi:hypothetical protein M9458_027754, partial [Cirrhinus mrigala]
VTSRVLWVLLRQYLGHGLRCLRLRGLLLSVRRGAFLTESWLQALRSKCPRLRRLYLQHTDLRGLHSCRLLPPSLQVLELSFCEDPETDGKASASAVTIETLVLNKSLHVAAAESSGAAGSESCVPPGAQTLGRLRHLELETWSLTQMVALGLGKGWPGLERLGLGGNESPAGPALAASAQMQTQPEDAAQMLQ